MPPPSRSLVVFFGLAFGLSWVVWVPAALASHGLLAVPIDPNLSGLLGVFGPFVAAVLSIALYEGRPGFRALARRLLVWRVGVGWYAFVLLWPLGGLVATTTLFTWVANNTGSSLLLALLFHTSIAVTGLFLSAADAHPSIEAGLSWAAAALVIAVFGPSRLTRALSSPAAEPLGSRGRNPPTTGRTG